MSTTLNHKEINKKIAELLGLPRLYDVRRELCVIQSRVTREEADAYIKHYTNEFDAGNAYEYAITTAKPEDYCSNIEHALYAARRIAERNQYTFVLSIEDGIWRAAFGSWGDCAEEVGANPAYITCLAILRFMGKV